MNFSWNLLGILAWVILLIWLIFVIHNIRRRHLKMIVIDKKKYSFAGSMIDLMEILVLVAGFSIMLYVTFFNRVNINNHEQVSLIYNYEPLVIQTNGDTGYYVRKSTDNNNSTDSYIYWEKNSKYKISSQNSIILYNSKDLDSSVANYPWKKEELIKFDKENQGAFVAKITAKYKNNPINGLGLKSNKKAEEFRLIKIPADNFIVSK